jgi:hypothetical protein
MGKNVLQAALPIAAAVAAPYALGAMGAGGALGAGTAATGAGAAGSAAGGAGALGGAFGSADMLAAATPGLFNAGAAAVPGSIETAGLLDMGGGNLVNPEYFVGESIGKPMFAGSSDLPFAERAGNVLGSMKDSLMPGEWDWMKGMKGMGQPQQTQQVSRPPAIQRPQAQPATETQLPYSQGVQLTPEQKEMLRQRMMMGGLLNGAA